jgi:predicted N-acetyltransferase YhbS
MEYTEYQPGEDKERDQALVDLFIATFSDSEGPDEGALIGTLVKDFLDTTAQDDLHIHVALHDNTVVGSAIFSRLSCEDGTHAFLMAPVAVGTSFQKKGVGQALISSGIEHLRAKGVQLVMSYGDIDFYARTGFVVVPVEVIPAPRPLSYPQGWIGQSLDGREIQPVTGGTRCVAAIDDGAYW